MSSHRSHHALYEKPFGAADIALSHLALVDPSAHVIWLMCRVPFCSSDSIAPFRAWGFNLDVTCSKRTLGVARLWANKCTYVGIIIRFGFCFSVLCHGH